MAHRVLLGRRLQCLPLGPESAEIPRVQLALRVTQMGLVEAELALIDGQRTAEPGHGQVPGRHAAVGRPRPVDVLRPSPVRQELQQAGRGAAGDALGMSDLGGPATQQQRRGSRTSERRRHPGRSEPRLVDPIPRRGRSPASHLESRDVTEQELAPGATLRLGHRQHGRKRTSTDMERPLEVRVVPVQTTHRQTVQESRVPSRQPLTGRQNRARTPADTAHSFQRPPTGYRNRRVCRHDRQPEAVQRQGLAPLDHRRRYVLVRQSGDPRAGLLSQGGGGSLLGLAIRASFFFENDHLNHLLLHPARGGTHRNPGRTLAPIPYASGRWFWMLRPGVPHSGFTRNRPERTCRFHPAGAAGTSILGASEQPTTGIWSPGHLARRCTLGLQCGLCVRGLSLGNTCGEVVRNSCRGEMKSEGREDGNDATASTES